ncbi:MAG TPA: NAD(P)/FAD-dependent oxidoreductase [Methylophilaceae bacterium]
MLRLTELKLPITHPESALKAEVLRRLDIPADQLLNYTIAKRSHDARKRSAIVFIYSIDVEIAGGEAAEQALLKRQKADKHLTVTPDTNYKQVAAAPADFYANAKHARPIVIGTGPCGMFAGLMLAKMGFKPIILERGKAVRERTKDTWGMWRGAKLNPESNTQFGEGGAGTFSDGKLYTQIKDPKHYGKQVVREFVKAGAPDEILYMAKPHIGTFKLVGIVENIRAQIVALGGEIRFESKVQDIDIENHKVRGVVLADGSYIASEHVVLAIGHSARDTFAMLYNRGVHIEAKPFSVGFRIEHPQSSIDLARFGSAEHNPLLGAADYSLVHHARNGRSVYSFCMCPGGTVVAAASEPGHLVTNGMSQYSRNERNANAGIVVGITPADYPGHPLAGIEFQRRWEARAYELGGSNYSAPVQMVGDFLNKKASTQLGKVEPSYTPGVLPTDLKTALPDYAISAIREALPAFDKQIKGFAKYDAVLTGVETRTSSPIRITRDDNSYQSLNTQGLYPAGEGAGYAGGILSAAIDGMKVAEAVALSLQS